MGLEIGLTNLYFTEILRNKLFHLVDIYSQI